MWKRRVPVSFSRQPAIRARAGRADPYRPSTHARGDWYSPEAGYGSDRDRGRTLHQNTLSPRYRGHPTQARLTAGTAGATGANKPIQKAPLDPGKAALDWMASLLMTLLSRVFRSLQAFSHSFRISENTETTSVLVN